jgi:hypothetical protein
MPRDRDAVYNSLSAYSTEVYVGKLVSPEGKHPTALGGHVGKLALVTRGTSACKTNAEGLEMTGTPGVNPRKSRSPI